MSVYYDLNVEEFSKLAKELQQLSYRLGVSEKRYDYWN